jgi:predicted transcriptional regulator
MNNKGIISREKFLKLPKGKTENKVLEIFQSQPNKAFKYSAICEMAELKKSTIYIALNNLIKTELIEKRGEYYALKEKKNGKENEY